MAKDNTIKATKTEVREYCFAVWRAESRDFSKTERRLKKENYCSATRPTLSRWAEAYGWVERADNLDLKEEKAQSVENEVLDNLVGIHRRIMEYLETRSTDNIETAKINTFVAVSGKITDIIAKIREGKLKTQTDEEKETVVFILKEI